MSCYVIAHVDITDPQRYRDSATGVVQQISEAGGRILAAGPAEALEGEPMVDNNVIIEFPDDAAARQWFHSEAYRAIVPIRHEASASSQVALASSWPPS